MTHDEAQELMIKLIILRERFEESKSKVDESAFRQHEIICINQFQYLITMRTNRYKQFANYEDLNQEGFEALLKAMKNYNPKKGSWFWWAHKYIDTKISRMANLHSAIRFPLKFAKQTAPHKENKLPTLIENRLPDQAYESLQIENLIHAAMPQLTMEERRVIIMAYGLDGEKPMSINRVCLKLNITRTTCKKLIDGALRSLMKNIQL